MKLKEFIEKLSQFDQDLPVCLDGSEKWDGPDNTVNYETIGRINGTYLNEDNKYVTGPYLCIG